MQNRYFAKPMHGRWREITQREYYYADREKELLIRAGDNPGIDLSETIGDGVISFNFTLALVEPSAPRLKFVCALLNRGTLPRFRTNTETSWRISVNGYSDGKG